MADQFITCVIAQRPGSTQWIAQCPVDGVLETQVTGSFEQLEARVRDDLSKAYPGRHIALTFRRLPFEWFASAR
jgi:hypothetical protein